MNISQSRQKATKEIAALSKKKNASFDDVQHGMHKIWTAHYERISQPTPKWVAGLIDY